MSAPQQSATPASLYRSDNANSYRDNANFVYSCRNTAAVLALLDAQPGDRVLDLGCGSGELTQALASTVASANGGSVLGLDASDDMIRAAKASVNDSQTPQAALHYQVADGCDLTRELEAAGLVGSFDKVFSNAAIHWMKASPMDVVQGVHAALKPSGIFAAEFGGFMNVIGLRGACHHVLREHGIDPETVDPWYFPTPEAYSRLLTSPDLPSPFDVMHCELVPRPTPLPSGVRGFFKTFCGPFLNALPSDKAREDAMTQLEETLRPDMYDPVTETWTAMYVRLRVKAMKKTDVRSAISEPGLNVTAGEAAKLARSPNSPNAQSSAQILESQFLNRTVLVHIPDGRVFNGVFTCVDDGSNLILSNVEEWRLHDGAVEGGDTEDRVVERRVLGMVMVRGEDIVRIEVKRDEGAATGGEPSRGNLSSRSSDAIAGAFADDAGRGVWPTSSDAYA